MSRSCSNIQQYREVSGSCWHKNTRARPCKNWTKWIKGLSFRGMCAHWVQNGRVIPAKNLLCYLPDNSTHRVKNKSQFFFFFIDWLFTCCLEKIPWLSRNEGNTFLAWLKLSSESQKHTDCKQIKCNTACVRRQCVLRTGKWSMRITFETSPSLCEAARTAMWGMTGGITHPKVLKCEPVQDRAHAKDKERWTHDHLHSNSNLQSEVGPWLKRHLSEWNVSGLHFSCKLSHTVRGKCLCSVLITPQ